MELSTRQDTIRLVSRSSYLPTYVFSYLPAYLPTYLPTLLLPTYLPTYLYIYPSIYLVSRRGNHGEALRVGGENRAALGDGVDDETGAAGDATHLHPCVASWYTLTCTHAQMYSTVGW